MNDKTFPQLVARLQYHLGTSYNRPTINGKMVHLSLMANPSHLEAVNTCVLGKVRAKQLLSVSGRLLQCLRFTSCVAGRNSVAPWMLACLPHTSRA